MSSDCDVLPLMLAAGKINYTDALKSLADPWILFGFLAQGVFASRFIVQWFASERRGESYVPVVFWYLSLLGTTLLAIYAIHRVDPVFILGQTLNIAIYVRNLMLIYRPRVVKTAPAPVADEDERLPVVAPDRADSRIMRLPRDEA